MRQEEPKEIILGEQALEVDIINHILKITKDLKEKFQIIVKSADILSGSRLNINTNEEWKIYFNLSGDMNLQITKLNLLLEKEITQESREGLEYIDLRFAERVYYK